MRPKYNFSCPVMLSLLFILSLAAPAYAYLDPGTGSMIYQIVIMIFLAAAAAFRFWWGRLKRLFGGGSFQDSENHEE
jgi:hypothetical protein